MIKILKISKQKRKFKLTKKNFQLSKKKSNRKLIIWYISNVRLKKFKLLRQKLNFLKMKLKVFLINNIRLGQPQIQDHQRIYNNNLLPDLEINAILIRNFMKLQT